MRSVRMLVPLFFLIVMSVGADVPRTFPAPFPGKQSAWEGYARYDFDVNTVPTTAPTTAPVASPVVAHVTVVAPKLSAAGKPWVWRAEFFGHQPNTDLALLGVGFHVVYVNVGNTFGCPDAMKQFDVAYAAVTKQYSLAKKPAFEALSRGGLYAYNWAAAHPDSVACIYGDAPVCDFKSWPAGKGKGKGSAEDWAKLQADYHFANEAAALAYDRNPVDRLKPLADAKVPLLHVCGDADDVVPYEENTGVVKARYEKLGGKIEVILKPGVGHHPHGLDDPAPIVEFIVKNAGNTGYQAGDGVVANGAKLETVSTAFAFTEGPAADAEGNVYFTDQPNDRILKWTAADNKIATFMQPCGRSNGLCFDYQGNLIACADEKNELWSIDVKTKAVTVLVKDYEGKLLNAPNDVWVHPGGGMYFSDPWYKRDYWKRGDEEQGGHHVYYRSADGRALARVTTDLTQPNGIIGTPDGKMLYVSDLNAKKTYSYSINADGSLADKKLFCALGSDGMTIDDEANVYLTNAKGVTVYDKSGKIIDMIPTGQPWTGNVCFGGKDGRTLFVTASKGVYTVRMRTRGAGSQ